MTGAGTILFILLDQIGKLQIGQTIRSSCWTCFSIRA